MVVDKYNVKSSLILGLGVVVFSLLAYFSAKIVIVEQFDFKFSLLPMIGAIVFFRVVFPMIHGNRVFFAGAWGVCLFGNGISFVLFDSDLARLTCRVVMHAVVFGITLPLVIPKAVLLREKLSPAAYLGFTVCFLNGLVEVILLGHMNASHAKEALFYGGIWQDIQHKLLFCFFFSALLVMLLQRAFLGMWKK